MGYDTAGKETVGHFQGEGRRVALVVSRVNEVITDRLAAGARACLVRHGVDPGDVEVIQVPGAWELPQTVRRVVDAGRHDAVVALGCVIRGATPHFDHVAGQAMAGLGAVARDSGTPVVMGILTTDTMEQALERSGIKTGNKGWEAALGALEMADLFHRLEPGER